jgi:hypothetical protein
MRYEPEGTEVGIMETSAACVRLVFSRRYKDSMLMRAISVKTCRRSTGKQSRFKASRSKRAFMRKW